MQAVAHTAEITTTHPTAIAAAVAATAANDHIGTASELVTERGSFQTVEELTAHCSIGYYTSAQMYRSRYNVRPLAADIKADVRELAALIASQGLLQNLVGYLDGEGKVAIVAGERRRNAIVLNIEEGLLPEDFLTPVLLITEAEAIAVSLAENSGRKDMHHADLSLAILALKNAEASVADIAVCFGLDELVVRRRLRLADLSPVIFNHYRNNEMSFEQVIAYTLVEDHAQQEAALAVVGTKGPAWKVREMLTAQKVDIRTNDIVKFVGVEAFEQAGGIVERDLFSTNGGGYIADLALLEKLALDKLQPEADKLRAQGFAWVDVKLSLTRGDLDQYATARWTKREATTEEAATLAALEKQQEEVADKLEEIQEVEEYDQEAYDAASAELDKLYVEHNAITDGLNILIDEDKPLAGALVFISYGKLEVRKGLIKPEDKKKMAKVQRPGLTAPEEAKARAVHSEALMHNLTTHRTLALRAELMDRPDIAIVLVTHRMMCRAFDTELHSWTRDSMTSISWEWASLDKDAEGGKAGQAIAARRAEIAALLPEGMNGAKLLPWLLEQDQNTIWKMFAYCSALSFDATKRKETDRDDWFVPVAKVLSLDMANWWEAGEDYFSRVNLARIVDVVKTVSTEVASRLEKMKKRDAVKAAIEAVKGSRWVPDFFRT